MDPIYTIIYIYAIQINIIPIYIYIYIYIWPAMYCTVKYFVRPPVMVLCKAGHVLYDMEDSYVHPFYINGATIRDPEDLVYPSHTYDTQITKPYMGGCQNHGPFLGP